VQVIAECLTGEEVESIKKMFDMMDVDKTGCLTFEQLRAGLQKIGSQLAESEVQQLMEAVSLCFSFLLIDLLSSKIILIVIVRVMHHASSSSSNIIMSMLIVIVRVMHHASSSSSNIIMSMQHHAISHVCDFELHYYCLQFVNYMGSLYIHLIDDNATIDHPRSVYILYMIMLPLASPKLCKTL
jgi:hypothetical protein